VTDKQRGVVLKLWGWAGG